jgi:hypothetical protein
MVNQTRVGCGDSGARARLASGISTLWQPDTGEKSLTLEDSSIVPRPSLQLGLTH